MRYKRLVFLWLLPFLLLAGCSSGDEGTGVSFRTEATGEEGKEPLDENMILPEGLYIDQIDAGGRTIGEVRAELEEAYARAGEQKATVYWQVHPVETTLANLGLYWHIDDVLSRAACLGKQGALIRQYKYQQDLSAGEYHIEMEKQLTESAVENFLTEYVADVYDVAPVDATLTHTGNGFEVSEDETGLCLNLGQTWKLLRTTFAETGEQEPLVIQAVVDVTYPHCPSEELKKIGDLLGSSYTEYYKEYNPARNTNVEVAARNVSGAILMPGDTVSTSELMKPRTEENGYRLGGTQVNGVIEDSLGGGICQVSTTLYNALLKAELQIDERYNHSMRVTYVDPAKDAAISDSKDLIFANNTEAPIYIEGYTDSGRVYFMVYGQETRPANRKVTYESTVTFEKEYAEGGVEMDAYLEKVVTIDGEEVSREILHKDHYEPSSRLNGTIS